MQLAVLDNAIAIVETQKPFHSLGFSVLRKIHNK